VVVLIDLEDEIGGLIRRLRRFSQMQSGVEREAMIFEAGCAKIDQQSKPEAGRFQLIDKLGFVIACQLSERFGFYN
jgi:hypothetical protein